jgi:tRNA(adenine34) deaminase
VEVERNDHYWMELALQQAQQAAAQGEVPVGAVLVDENSRLIGSGHNQPISSHDPSAHAEIVAMRHAAAQIENYRLVNTTLYVTLEPCLMCVGAMIHARIKRLVYGALEHKTGAIVSHCQILDTTTFNHQIEIQGGILEQECASILSRFFEQRRLAKRASKKA